MNDAPPILTMEEVSKTYSTPAGPVRALRRVNASVRRGEFLAVTGPSGSGKTTFLNLASLLDQPSAGRMRFGGRDASQLDDAARSEIRKRRIGMVFQNFSLLPSRTVIENVRFRFRYVDSSPAEVRECADCALAAVALSHLAHKPVRLLSGGEMQRVAIARAIALPPDLLLADEPTGNLDAESAVALMQHFTVLNRAGMAIVLVTHNLALLPYCSRTLRCENGTISD